MYIPRVLTYIYVYKYLHTYIYIYLEKERERDSERLDKTSYNISYLQYVFRSVICLEYHMCNTICIVHYVHIILYCILEFGATHFEESNIQQRGHVGARHIELNNWRAWARVKIEMNGFQVLKSSGMTQ